MLCSKLPHIVVGCSQQMRMCKEGLVKKHGYGG